MINPHCSNNNLKQRGLPISAYLTFIVLIAIALRFIVLGWQGIIANGNSNAGDQGVTLQLGLDLKEKGILSDGTRHPLYPLLLLPFAKRSWNYFTWAKIVSLACGVGVILLLFLLGRYIAGQKAALLAALILSLNVEFIYHSTTALAESLLVLVFWIGWYFLYCAVSQKDGLRKWTLVGLFSGLAYLTKGTGNFLLIAGLIAAILTHWPHPRRIAMSILAQGATFSVVTAPLLLFNYWAFGSPFYNFATTHAMWLDKWRQSWVEDPHTLPTVTTYFATHTLYQALERLWNGAIRLWLPFWETITPWAVSFEQTLSRLLGYQWLTLLVMVMLGVGTIVVARPHLAEHLRTNAHMMVIKLMLFGLTFLMFAWYTNIVIAARFFLFLIPIASLLAAQAFWFVCERILLFIGSLLVTGVSRIHGKSLCDEETLFNLITTRLSFIILIATSVWFVMGTLPRVEALENPFEADSWHNHDAEQVLHWLTAGELNKFTVLWGPSHSLPFWKYTDRIRFRILPVTVNTISQALAYPAAIDADYVILDVMMVSRYKSIFRDYIDYRSGRLELRKPIPNWSLAHVYKSYPADWCVFVPQEKLRLINLPDVVSDRRLRWLGYGLVKRSVVPGETISVWFEWQLLMTTDRNYTVFVHLVKDNTLWGQKDRQPLFGLWPSSQWFPGTRVVDRFDVPVSTDTPPGSYYLHFGVYDSVSGQRFSMTSAGHTLQDNVFKVDGIVVSDVHRP
ncbi:MAG: glycosyltransferase family 39 protein [Anaerolineae bacterium]|nr:glycosyltransferase family 39 protein [Anaerolineae bacterium]MDW8069875.1 glycosyltransferase family 39 protein [Anaerolineae bacterium]